jgi:hypothetical protein
MNGELIIGIEILVFGVCGLVAVIINIVKTYNEPSLEETLGYYHLDIPDGIKREVNDMKDILFKQIETYNDLITVIEKENLFNYIDKQYLCREIYNLLGKHVDVSEIDKFYEHPPLWVKSVDRETMSLYKEKLKSLSLRDKMKFIIDGGDLSSVISKLFELKYFVDTVDEYSIKHNVQGGYVYEYVKNMILEKRKEELK